MSNIESNTIGKNESFILDFLRAITAQLVLISHGITFLIPNEVYKTSRFIGYIAPFGVIIFFLLSGYLITHSAKKKNLSYEGFKIFLIDRFSRIYTPFIPCLILISLIDWINIRVFNGIYLNEKATGIATFLGNLFMLQNRPSIGVDMHFNSFLFGVDQFGSARPLWTVSFEWWLYISFGLIFFLRKKIFKLHWFLLFIFTSYVPIGNVLPLNVYASGLTLAWIAGSIFWLTRNIWLRIPLFLWIFVLFTSSSFFIQSLFEKFVNDEFINPYSAKWLILLTIIFSSLIGVSKTYKKKINLNSSIPKFIKILANYSYTLYLLHYTFQVFLVNLSGRISNVYLLILLILVPNVFSYYFAKYTELKFVKVRNLIKNKFV